MEKLTTKEEEVMQILWELQKAFVKEVIEKYSDPKPAYTTISSIIRILESKGFVAHQAFGNTHQYYPIIKKEDYRSSSFSNFVERYFDSSVKNVVSFLIKEEKLSDKEIAELQELLNKK